jgi:hypothetical protein
MVGFTRYKFFLQFVTYTALFCCFVVASVAPVPLTLTTLTVVDETEYRRKQHFPCNMGSNFNSRFIFCIIHDTILNVPRLLYTRTYYRTHIYYALKNVTTNESFDHKVWRLQFMLITASDVPFQCVDIGRESPTYPFIEFPAFHGKSKSKFISSSYCKQ